MSTNSTRTKRPNRGFSLAALFVLVTVSAVAVAGIAPLFRNWEERRIDPWAIPVWMLAGMLSGLTLGIAMGLHHFRVGRGIGLGAVAGMVLGALAGPMCLLLPADLPSVGLAMFVGSLFIVGVASVTRIKS